MLTILTPPELRRLDALYLRLHRAAVELRAREPLACHVHLPKLPEALTISIVAELAPQLLGAAVRRAPAPHDLITTDSVLVAVKGTSAGWTTITATDRAARLLVIVDYADRLAHAAPATVTAFDAQILAVAPARLTRAQLDRLAAPLSRTQWERLPEQSDARQPA